MQQEKPRRSIESVELLEAPGYVYRAGVSANGEYWARDLGVAIAYRHNPGFGGERIYRTKLPANLNILDLRRNCVHHQWLEETLGDDWMERYETEAWATASPDAIKRLEVDGYDGVMYLDDYPDGAETIFIPGGVTGDEIEVPVLEGLLFWKKSGWDTRGYANDEITVYLIDKLYEKDSDTGEFELIAEKYSFGTRLVRNIVDDLSYDEFETLLNGGSVRYRGDEIVLRDGMVSSAPPPSRGYL